MNAIYSPTIIGLFWAGSAAGIGWYLAYVARQINYVTLADGRKQARNLPVLFRIMLPFAGNLNHFFARPAFTSAKERLDRDIVSSGYEGLLTGDEFLSLRALLTIGMGGFYILLISVIVSLAPTSLVANHKFFFASVGPVWFFLYPGMWLKRVLTERHRAIRRALPFVLDVLTLSVEAGMDFMTSLQRHIERSPIDPFVEELIRVTREIQLGKTRREALRDMSRRVNLSDLRSVVNALVQADELGVSIGSILRIQADQIRQRRFERAEKLANEAPVKMLGPLLFFIFPAVFLILLGPIVYKMMQQMM